ncbi:MAG TPA: hypothetical protein VMY34_01090, partial [Acidimicrobiales bacterium]|nr:hypothetical protein [Acidimicrobiales bacterium]
MIDDHVDRASTLPNSLDHARWAYAWVGQLDEAIEAQGTATASAQLVLPFLTAAITSALLLGAAVRALDPDEILYVGPPGLGPDPSPMHRGHLQFWPRMGDAPLARRLLPLVGSQVGAEFRAVDTRASQPLRHGARRSMVVEIARDIRRAHRLAGPEAGTGGHALITWMGGYGLRAVVGVVRDAGAGAVFLDRGRHYTRVLRPRRIGFEALTPPIPVKIEEQWAEPAPNLLPLVDEIDRVAGLSGLGKVVAGRVGMFAGSIVPVVQDAATELAQWFGRLGITRVLTANPASIEEFAALAAAGWCGITRELYQHGDHAFTYDPWLITELQHIDTFRTSDSTLTRDVPRAAVLIGARCPEIVVDSPRVASLQS